MNIITLDNIKKCNLRKALSMPEITQADIDYMYEQIKYIRGLGIETIEINMKEANIKYLYLLYKVVEGSVKVTLKCGKPDKRMKENIRVLGRINRINLKTIK